MISTTRKWFFWLCELSTEIDHPDAPEQWVYWECLRYWDPIFKVGVSNG